jgi:hypothetical protein
MSWALLPCPAVGAGFGAALAVAAPAASTQATAEELGEQLILLVGDVFLGAAAISYLGAFTGVCTALLESLCSNPGAAVL